MNERIKELANRAMVEREDGWHEFDPYVFAELIIKEYEKLLPEICPWDQAGKEGPMKGWHVQFVARKHFGIE
jgi:hypothetical protein